MEISGRASDAQAQAVADLVRTIPGRFALCLDFGGTLVDVAPLPDEIVRPRSLVPTLTGLTELLHGAVAVLSGRPLQEIDRFLAPLKLAAVGVHGAEIRRARDGSIEGARAGLSDEVRREIVQAVEGLGQSELVIEQKSASVAVHVRAAPEMEAEVVRRLQEIIARRTEALRIELGRRVIEVIAEAVSKGRGLAALLQGEPFKGRRPVVIGDDVSDEAAFAVAREAGGFALAVAGERYRRDEAVFGSAQDVREWLAKLL